MARRPKDGVKLNLRFDEKLRQKLEKSASKRGISLNSEILNRIEQSFEWEAAHGRAQDLVKDAQEVVEKNLDAHLRAKGYTPVATLNGHVWLSPKLDPLKVAVWTDPTEFQKAQEAAIKSSFREIIDDMKKRGGR